jgi:hypothetical protein
MSDENTQVTENNNASTNNTQDLPDWARKAISEANSEAAKYRTKASAAADEAKAEVTATFNQQIQALSDEKSAITAERDKASTNYERLVAALGAGVPGETAVEFAARLQGNNLEEFKADAEKLKSALGTGAKVRPVDKSAGLSGETKLSPEEAFAALFQSNMRK